MDLAYSYDHINNTDDRSTTPTPPNPPSTDTLDEPPTPKASQSQPQPTQPQSPSQPQLARQSLQNEFQETFRAFSASPWGAKLGGLWGNVRQQSSAAYEEAIREAEAARIDALKGFSDIRQGIVGRVRSLSVSDDDQAQAQAQTQTQTHSEERDAVKIESTPVPGEEPMPLTGANKGETDSVLADTETLLNRFKTEAAKRLRDVQKAEDAADEALLRFGTTIRSFLRDAVVITQPDDEQQPGEVMFECKDAAGRRRIHASRMDAQLFAIHTSKDGFLADPEEAAGWKEFKGAFDVEGRTEEIARDLEMYPELRKTMEGLVPEKVEYLDFWARYYFLRRALEVQEERRRELLKATTTQTEEISWDEDSDDEPTKPKPPHPTNDSSSTINQPAPTTNATNTSSQPPIQSQPGTSTQTQIPSQAPGLRPHRRSHDEKSVADSEASYDIVSGATSRAASSPKERNKELGKGGEESDDDWE